MSHWPTAFDDGLRETLTACTACGSRSQPAWYQIVQVGPLALAVRLCFPCKQHDSQLTQVLALLEARYEGV